MKSKNLKTIDKSIKIDNLSEAKDVLLSGKVWYNSNMTPGLPSYAAPILSQGKVVAFIFIMKAKLNQLSLYYSNIFSVLSGLVQDALVRAIKEEKAAESTTYIEGTRVHREEAFKKIYDANLLLSESEKIGLSLLEINAEGGDMAEISSRLENSLRETDTIGILSATRNLLGVQLINTVGDDLSFVLGRLTAAGIAANPVKVFSI
jgi:UDP-glucose 4-epimerase